MSAAVSTRSALDSSGYMRGTQQKLVRCAGEVRRCGGLNYHSGAHGALGTVLSMPTSGSLSLLLQNWSCRLSVALVCTQDTSRYHLKLMSFCIP